MSSTIAHSTGTPIPQTEPGLYDGENWDNAGDRNEGDPNGEPTQPLHPQSLPNADLWGAGWHEESWTTPFSAEESLIIASAILLLTAITPWPVDEELGAMNFVRVLIK